MRQRAVHGADRRLHLYEVHAAGGRAGHLRRQSIRGSVPGVVTPLAQDFYNLRYKTAYPDTPLTFGMAGAYDATYMFAYVMAALSKANPTGRSSSAARRKSTSGRRR